MTPCARCERVKPIKSRGLCNACECRSRKDGTIGRYENMRVLQRRALIENYWFLRETGEAFEGAAVRLSRSPGALKVALYRAGERQVRRAV